MINSRLTGLPFPCFTSSHSFIKVSPSTGAMDGAMIIEGNTGRFLGFPLTAAFLKVVAGLPLSVIQNRSSVQNHASRQLG